MVSRIVACEAPYSFFFSLIERHWKCSGNDNSPLHRLATLARKQGAKALVIDDASDLPCVAFEIGALDESYGGGGAAEAYRFSFLSEIPEGEDIGTVGEGALIGLCILINYRAPGSEAFCTSFVFEAFFATPSLEDGQPLLNNFINCEAAFTVDVRGRAFTIRGLYYAQQNGITSVCAHACIRMATRTMFPARRSPSTQEIDKQVGDASSADGMRVEQIADALAYFTGADIAQVNCDGLQAGEYASILTAVADSGDIALLVFKTGPKGEFGEVEEASDQGPQANHVVVVFGYSRNSDEWHPQAMPEYSGAPSARHSPASAWADHFIIHDDNFGPYLTLSSRALEADPSVEADHIIVVRRLKTNFDAHVAEAASAIILTQATQFFADDAPDNRWLNYLLRYAKPFVTRPVLLTRDEYSAHLSSAVAHDGSTVGAQILEKVVNQLPEILWMVEFTVPDLYTGNHSKLGEVLLDANLANAETFSEERFTGIRVPSRFMLARPGVGEDALGFEGRTQRQVVDFPLTSHIGQFERNPPARQW